MEEAGWCASVVLPYRRRENPVRWEVDFDGIGSDYNNAIAAGWHPAELIDINECPW